MKKSGGRRAADVRVDWPGYVSVSGRPTLPSFADVNRVSLGLVLPLDQVDG